jgi:glutamate carboxypeptidase
VHGKASHAGLEPEKGVNAILGMVEVVRALAALNDYPRGVSVSVGIISGGLRSNVVAPECRAEVDVRAVTVADAERLEQAIRELAAPLPGATLTITGGFDRAPLERTPRNVALWELARETGAEMGLTLEETAVGGGSDGNLTSAHAATLDGLGPVGDGAHARHEHVIISKMIERSALLAALMMKQ